MLHDDDDGMTISYYNVGTFLQLPRSDIWQSLAKGTSRKEWVGLDEMYKYHYGHFHWYELFSESDSA